MLVSTPSGQTEFAERRNWYRWVVFLAVFVVSAGASLTYVFSRVPEYRAIARIEIPPARTIGEGDQTRPPGLQDQPASFLTEVQTLTSRPIISEALNHLGQTVTISGFGPDPIDGAQQLLHAQPIEHTQIVELSAEGPQRDLLWRLINAMTDVYRERTAGRYEQHQSTNYDEVKDEVANLHRQAVAKRKAVDAFGAANNIVSLERNENSVLAEVENLSHSYSSSVEALARAQGHVEALNKTAAASGAPASLKDDAATETLEQQASSLREQLTELERKFTPAFLALDSNTATIRARIAGLERQIAAQRIASQKAGIAAAEEELQTAKAQVDRLRVELADNQKKAQLFAIQLAQYKSMQQDLDHLENIERLTADRLIKMEATERESAPHIEILEPAAPTQRPVRPDYPTNAAIAVSGSFGLGIFAVWFVGFVGAPRRKLEWQGVQLHSPLQSPTLARFADQPLRLTREPAIQFLPRAPLPRELEDEEIIRLISNSSWAVALACVGLLSGLSASVLIGLSWDEIDLEASEIRLRGSPPRTVSVEEPFATLLRQEHDSSRASSTVLHDQNNAPWGVDGLAHQMLCAAYDAALERPEEITPSALRHTYLVWLFRQGIRAGDVMRIAGNLSDKELAGYLQLFAGGARASISEIDPVHPALRKLPLGGARAF